MTRTEYNGMVSELFSDTALITPGTLRTFFSTLGDLIFNVTDNSHTESASVSLIADTATNVYFCTVFDDTNYALTLLAKDADGNTVACTVEKYTDRITVTATGSDATIDFVAVKSTTGLPAAT